MKLLIVCCAFLLTTVFSCKQSTKKPSLNKEQITNDVLKMFDNYHNAIKANGLVAEFEYLDKSSDFFWVPPGYSSALSYDSVKSILIQNSKIISGIEFTWDTLQVFPLSQTIANYSGIVNGLMTDSTALKSEFKILESGTLIKREDGWKLLNGQSRNLP